MTTPAPCAGSGAWVGWGWSWYPCPVCRERIDVDGDTLELKEHAPPTIAPFGYESLEKRPIAQG